MSNDWRTELDEFGIPVAALEAAIGEHLGAFARTAGALNQAQQDPWFRANEARIEDYLKRENEVRETAQRLAAADPAGALEFIRLKYRDSQADRTRPHFAGATLIPLGGPPIPEAPPPRGNPYRDEPSVEEAGETYRRTGTRQAAERYAHARLRNVISDEFLNQ